MMIEIIFHSVLSPSPVVPPPKKIGVEDSNCLEAERCDGSVFRSFYSTFFSFYSLLLCFSLKTILSFIDFLKLF